MPSQEMVKVIQKKINQDKQLQLQKTTNTVNISNNKEQPNHYKLLVQRAIDMVKTDPDELQVILERDADEYKKLVNTQIFQRNVNAAIANPRKTQADIVRIQLL